MYEIEGWKIPCADLGMREDAWLPCGHEQIGDERAAAQVWPLSSSLVCLIWASLRMGVLALVLTRQKVKKRAWNRRRVDRSGRGRYVTVL